MLELVNRSKACDIDLTFKDRLNSMRTAEESKHYFLITLDVQNSDIHLNDGLFKLRENHLSVFRCYHDNKFGFTAYHYTADISDNDRNRFTLHAYYDSYGNYLHCQLKNQAQEEIEIIDDVGIMALSGQRILPLIGEINAKLEKKMNALNDEVVHVQSDVEVLSKTLFGASLTREKARSVYDSYTKLMERYLAKSIERNSFSFTPDQSLVNFLTKSLARLKSLEILNNIVKRFGPVEAKQTQKSMPKKKKGAAKVEKSVQPKEVKPVKAFSPSIDDDYREIKLLRGQLKDLRNSNSAKASLTRFNVIGKLYKMTSGTELDKLLSLISERDSLILLSQQKIEELAAVNKVKDITALYKIAGDISTQAIIAAVKSNSLEALDFLLTKYKRSLDIYDCGISLLSYNEEVELPTFERLLRKGANPNMVGIFGNSPLQDATKSGMVKLMALFLKYKADVNYQSIKPASIIAIEKKPSNYKLQKMLQEEINRPDDFLTALHFAIQKRHFPAVRLMIEAGANQLLRDKDGFTPVSHCSALNNKAEPLNDDARAIMHYLFAQQGCDINVMVGRPGLRATMLHFSLQYQRYDYTVELLKLGADPNILREHCEQPIQRIAPLVYCAARLTLAEVALFIEHENVPLTIQTLACAIGGAIKPEIKAYLCGFMLDRFLNDTVQADPVLLNRKYGLKDRVQTMLDYALLFNYHDHVRSLVALGAIQTIVPISSDSLASLTIDMHPRK